MGTRLLMTCSNARNLTWLKTGCVSLDSSQYSFQTLDVSTRIPHHMINLLPKSVCHTQVQPDRPQNSNRTHRSNWVHTKPFSTKIDVSLWNNVSMYKMIVSHNWSLDASPCSFVVLDPDCFSQEISQSTSSLTTYQLCSEGKHSWWGSLQGCMK